MLASRYLLVVVTPNALAHPDHAGDWMAREAADFAAGANAQNVIAVRGAGEFNDPLPDEIRTRFPNIEIVDLRGAGRFWRLNPTRAGHLGSEKLKLVAPLLGIPFDAMPVLRQEEERRQQFRMGSVLGATLGVLISVSGLSIFALESRNQAVRSLEDSMFATGSMVLLSAGLPTGDDDAEARTRRLLINQGCDLIDKLSSGSGRKPQIAELVTCRLERARSRENLGEQEEARAQYDEAIKLAGERYARLPRADAADRLIEARQAYAEYLARQHDRAAEEAQYGRLRDDARRLAADLPDRGELARAAGEALGQLGDLLRGRNEPAQAGESYDEAAQAVRKEVSLEADKASAQTVAWLVRLHRLAGEQHLQLNDPDGAADRFRRALDARGLIAADKPAPALDWEAAFTQARMFDLERGRGNGPAAASASAEVLSAVARILEAAAATPDLKGRATQLKTWIEQQLAAK